MKSTIRFRDEQERSSFYLWIAKQGFRSLQSWFNSITDISTKENYENLKLCRSSSSKMEEKIAEIIWKAKFNKNKPNLPFKIEEEEVDKIVREIMKIVLAKMI